MFEGTHTALVTPLSGDKVDYEALGKLIDSQLEAKVEGIVPCGSTGESATLSHGEHETVIAFCVERAAGRLKVIAGTGSNSTAESIRLTRFAAEHGADGALLIAPYYNKPTQDGIYAHYSAVSDAVDLPLVVYNIPGRAAVNIAPETMGRLAQRENIVGVKEASGSLDQVSRTVQLCGPDFTVLAGDDTLTLPIMAVGGRGVIAVLGNILPAKLKRMVDAANAGELETARTLHYEMLPIMLAMGLETNPIPVKTALAMMGKLQEGMRLPLTPMTPAHRDALKTQLHEAGLLG